MQAICSNRDCRMAFNLLENPSQYCSKSCQNDDIYRPSFFLYDDEDYVDDFVKEFVTEVMGADEAAPKLVEPMEALQVTTPPKKKKRRVSFKEDISEEVIVPRWYPRHDWMVLDLMDKKDKKTLWKDYKKLRRAGEIKIKAKSTDNKKQIASAIAVAILKE